MDPTTLKQKVVDLLKQLAVSEKKDLPEGTTEKEIQGFEARTGLLVPEELKEWLRTSNAPLLGPGGLFGIQAPKDFLDMEKKFFLYPEWQKLKWVPIAGDGCGNYYVVDTTKPTQSGHPVYFIDAMWNPNEPMYAVASNVWHFLEFLLEKELGKEDWPFEKGYTLAKDPDLTLITHCPLPWTLDEWDQKN